MQNITDKDELLDVMKTHIDAVLGRYGDRLAHMDVVNEREYRCDILGIDRQADGKAILDDGTWRPSVFYDLLGEDFVGIAVCTAASFSPIKRLMIIA